MDLAVLIKTALDIFSKLRAATTLSDYFALVGPVLDFVKQLTALLPAPSPTPVGPVMMASPAKAATFAAHESKSIEELCDDGEAICNNLSDARGPFIDALLPILAALIKKLLPLILS